MMCLCEHVLMYDKKDLFDVITKIAYKNLNELEK